MCKPGGVAPVLVLEPVAAALAAKIFAVADPALDVSFPRRGNLVVMTHRLATTEILFTYAFGSG
jgi:hypothetical protein